jgi:hypothetical protein
MFVNGFYYIIRMLDLGTIGSLLFGGQISKSSINGFALYFIASFHSSLNIFHVSVFAVVFFEA